MTRLLDGSDAGELWPLVDEPTFYDEFLVEQDSVFAERDARDRSPQSPKAPVIPSPPRMAGADGEELKIIESADDVTGEILLDAEQVFDGWFADEPRIDWEDFIDRLCKSYGNHANPPWDIESYDTAAVRKIQRHVREYRDSG